MDFDDLLGSLFMRKQKDQDTLATKLRRPADRAMSGVCDLGFHNLCSGLSRTGQLCRCQHHPRDEV